MQKNIKKQINYQQSKNFKKQNFKLKRFAFQFLIKIRSIESQPKQLKSKHRIMGCFPDKPINRAQPLSPQKERLIRRFQQENPNNDSVYLPINIKSSHFKKHQTPKSRKSLVNSPKKIIGTPMKGRKSPTKRYALSQQKPNNIKIQQGKLVRKQVDGRPVVRKKGTVIELPFRQHAITRIETPSQTAQTSLLSNLQKHPSDFFTKFQSKLIKAKSLQKQNQIGVNYQQGSFQFSSMQQEPKQEEGLIKFP